MSPELHYSGGDPVNGSDPSGREELADVAVIDAWEAFKNTVTVGVFAATVACAYNIIADEVGGIAANIGNENITVQRVGLCDAYVKSNRRKTDQIITYRTINPPPSCGKVGSNIFSVDFPNAAVATTGFHTGILRDSLVYDNFYTGGISESLWSNGAYEVFLDCSNGAVVGPFSAAVARGIGVITIE